MFNKDYKPSGICVKNNPKVFRYGFGCKQFNGICTRCCGNCKNYSKDVQNAKS